MENETLAQSNHRAFDARFFYSNSCRCALLDKLIDRPWSWIEPLYVSLIDHLYMKVVVDANLA